MNELAIFELMQQQTNSFILTALIITFWAVLIMLWIGFGFKHLESKLEEIK